MFQIIIPAYNVENYIEKCLDSVLQNISAEDHVTIVNDGSTDRTNKILEYVKYSSFKVINQSNQGLSAARNAGLNHIAGEYVIFLDSDDYLEDGCIDKIKKFIIANHYPELILTNTNITNGVSVMKVISPEVKFLSDRKIHLIPPAAWDKIYKVDLIKKVGLRFPPGRYFEDLPAIYPILFMVRSFVKYDGVMVNWYQRDNSISRSPVFLEKYFDVFKNFENLTETLKICEEDYTMELHNIYYKKILLDTLIRWWCTGRDINVFRRIATYSNNISTFSDLLRSKITFEKKILLGVFLMLSTIFNY